MPDENAVSSVHSIVGDEGFQRLVAAFYRRIPGDDLLGPMYPAHDLAGAEHRLCSFLIFRFGGSDRYLNERGHPQLRGRHGPFAIDHAARDRWVYLMDEAIKEVSLPADVVDTIRDFLREVATFLINRGSKPAIVS